MVGVLASSAVDRGCEPRSGQTKDYKICICCFAAKHAVLRRKGKDWLMSNDIGSYKFVEIILWNVLDSKIESFTK
jgi:hypothetical protein